MSHINAIRTYSGKTSFKHQLLHSADVSWLSEVRVDRADLLQSVSDAAKLETVCWTLLKMTRISWCTEITPWWGWRYNIHPPTHPPWVCCYNRWVLQPAVRTAGCNTHTQTLGGSRVWAQTSVMEVIVQWQVELWWTHDQISGTWVRSCLRHRIIKRQMNLIRKAPSQPPCSCVLALCVTRYPVSTCLNRTIMAD